MASRQVLIPAGSGSSAENTMYPVPRPYTLGARDHSEGKCRIPFAFGQPPPALSAALHAVTFPALPRLGYTSIVLRPNRLM